MCNEERNSCGCISETLKKHFIKIGNDFQITLEEWNHDVDHIHVLFRSEPTTNLSKFINTSSSIKTESG